MKLPFWDDFSFNDPAKNYPHDSLWQFGHSVLVNTGMGINPPTLKVATFDGVDSLGLPYNINQALAKGVADKLTSRPIRMDLVNAANKANPDSVFIFFYYQYQGRGEAPDPGDEFSLWFKNDSSVWVKVWSDTIRNHDNTKFVPVKFYVSDSAYFHKDFQFRFQNYARLSGPFDTWNLDYVYINNGKSQYLPNLGYKDFPDRAIAAPMTSLLKQYQSIPAKHFLYTGDSLLNTPSIVVTNQRRDQAAPGFQPLTMTGHVKVSTRLNKVVSTPINSKIDIIGENVSYGSPQSFPIQNFPSFASLDAHIDSIAVKFNFKLISGDDSVKIDDPSNRGDYDTVVYKPIVFKHNDTTSANFILSRYYAYDDGIAEYAASLTGAGNYLAYQFDMAYSKPDTLVAVDIYFPHVGDETSQVLNLMILDNQVLDSNTKNPLVLTQQDLTVSRSENNKFTRVKLNEAVVVSQMFYVAYKQNVNATIGVGLDKNSDSGNKIFTNLSTGWGPSDLHGNLMIRPVFGNTAKAKGIFVAVEEKKLFAYPNPNHGVFYFPQAAQNISIVDIAGRNISFVQEDSFESTQVTLRNPTPGIYVACYFNGASWQVEKIMVLP